MIVVQLIVKRDRQVLPHGVSSVKNKQIRKKGGGGADNTKGVMGWSGARAGRGADVAAVPDVRSSS